MSVLTFDEYQQRAETTAIYPGKGELGGLLYVGLGLGESGEVQGKIKKLYRDLDIVYNKDIPEDKREAIIAELGDLLWYVANMATELGYSLEDVAINNLNKLADRKKRNVLGGSGDYR